MQSILSSTINYHQTHQIRSAIHPCSSGIQSLHVNTILLSSVQSHILTSAYTSFLWESSASKNLKVCSAKKKWVLHKTGLELCSLKVNARKASWRKHIFTELGCWYSLDTVSLGACGRDLLTLKVFLWWCQTSDLRGGHTHDSAAAGLWTTSAEKNMRGNYCLSHLCPLVNQAWSVLEMSHVRSNCVYLVLE